MHRTNPRGAPQAPPRTRTLDVRPGRLAAAGLAVVTLTAVLLLFWAAAAQASVWVIPAMARAYPTTQPGARQSVSIDAAGNEYQGVQLCLRGGERKVRLTWSADSSPLIRDNAELFRVFYVKVTTPTTKLGSRKGWYPDPLVPRDFGALQSVPGSVNPGPTTPFYILVHVPLGTPAGTYAAHAARGERRRGEGRAVQPAGVELRLEQDQHALGLRHEPGQPRAQPASQLRLRRAEQGRGAAQLLHDDEAARDLTDDGQLPAQGVGLVRRRRRGRLGEQGRAVPRRDRRRRRPAGQPAPLPALVPLEPEPEPGLIRDPSTTSAR